MDAGQGARITGRIREYLNVKLFYYEPIGAAGGTLSMAVEEHDDIAGSISAFLYAKAQLAPPTTAAAPTPPVDIKLGTTAAPIDGAIMYNSSDDATGAADTGDSEPAAEAAAPAPILEPEPVAEATAEEATDALRSFLKAHPLPAAVSILKDFGVARVPELAPEKRAAFIARLQSTGKTPEATK